MLSTRVYLAGQIINGILAGVESRDINPPIPASNVINNTVALMEKLLPYVENRTYELDEIEYGAKDLLSHDEIDPKKAKVLMQFWVRGDKAEEARKVMMKFMPKKKR